MNKKTFLSIILAIVAAGLIAVIIVLAVGFFSKDDSPISNHLPEEELTVNAGVLELGSATAKAGEEITVPITLKKNPGVWGLQLHFDYDKDALTYVGISNKEFFDEYDVNINNGMGIINTYQSDITTVNKDGTVAELTFKINPDTKPGKYTLKIAETTFCPTFEEDVVDEISVVPQYINSEITVE